MKFEAINKRFNEIAASYMANGYYINAGTMSGSQGEIAHIDLTDGKEIIRIVVGHFMEEVIEYGAEGIEIVVGRSADRVAPNKNRAFDTIWNNHLEVLYTEKYYEIGRHRDGDSWYGTKEECEAKWQKYEERFNARRISSTKALPEEAKKAALSFVKRQPKCKGTKLADINAVEKRTEKNSFTGKVSVQYRVIAKGKTYILK